MPPFAPFKGIIPDLRLHPRPQEIGDGSYLLNLTFLVDLPRTGGEYDQFFFRTGKSDI